MAKKLFIKVSTNRILARAVLDFHLPLSLSLSASRCVPDNVGVAAGAAVCCSGQVNSYVLAVNFASFDLQHAQLGNWAGTAGCSCVTPTLSLSLSLSLFSDILL